MRFATALATLASAATLALAQVRTGDATFFAPGLGSCGHQNTGADFIVAIDAATFDTFPGAGANPNLNPVCGKTITASFGGASVVATVVDRCPGCAPGSIDFSEAAFKQLASTDVGRIHGVTWSFN